MSFRGIDPVKLVNNGVMTGTNVLTAASMDMLHSAYGSLQAVWTGTPTGTLTLNGSNDNVTFTALAAPTFAGGANPAGGALSAMIALNAIGFRYAQLIYTNVSGVGALTVVGMSKQI